MSAAERIFEEALALPESQREELASRLIESLEDKADRDAVASRALEPLTSLDKAMFDLEISRADFSR
jgi:hypothetical protein